MKIITLIFAIGNVDGGTSFDVSTPEKRASSGPILLRGLMSKWRAQVVKFPKPVNFTREDANKIHAAVAMLDDGPVRRLIESWDVNNRSICNDILDRFLKESESVEKQRKRLSELISSGRDALRKKDGATAFRIALGYLREGSGYTVTNTRN